MSKSLKIAALTAFALITAGSFANAAPPHDKRQSLSQGNSSHPFKHQSGSTASGMQTSGSHKVVVAHCDPGPCKGSKPHHPPSHPVVITHCDPGPCKGTHHPGKPIKVTSDGHHKPPFWHHHHYQQAEYRDRYVYGYRPTSYAPRPSYAQPSYAPRPSYAAYAPTPAAQAPAPSCLSKEYLTNGPVLFKDSCTKEWAMGEASPTRGLNVGCLHKEYVDGGTVKFTDICTKEWATNAPANQQAEAPADQQTKGPAAAEEERRRRRLNETIDESFGEGGMVPPSCFEYIPDRHQSCRLSAPPTPSPQPRLWTSAARSRQASRGRLRGRSNCRSCRRSPCRDRPQPVLQPDC